MIVAEGQLVGPIERFAGFGVSATFTARPTSRDAGSRTPSTPRAAEQRVAVGAAGEFRVAFPDVELVGSVTFRAHLPSGAVVATLDVAKDRLGDRIVLKLPSIAEPASVPNPDPDSGKNVRLAGVVVDATGKVRPSGVAVSVKVRAQAADPERAVLVATTDGHGGFGGPYPRGRWAQAWAEVSLAPGTRLPIALQADGTLPRRIVLAVPIGLRPPSGEDCACDGVVVPRNPDASSLVEDPEAYSSDKGGRCVSFTVPNRTVEEHHYTLVVRTSDPEIRGLTLEDDSRRYLPDAVVADLSGFERPTGRPSDRPFDRPAAARERPAGGAVDPIREPSPVRPSLPGSPADAQPATPPAVPPPAVPPPAGPPAVPPRGGRPARVRFDIWKRLGATPTKEALAAAETESTVADALEELAAVRGRAPGRSPLGPANPLDWDEDPTFYEATTIAHGHLVSFKQVWKADGYSLGDLVYSLPLAPAQKKQVAVIDWERRETGARSEELSSTERLAAELSRDRDILEIVDTTVAESMKGASGAVTAAGAKTRGGADGGNLMGVAGGGGGAASGAIQDSHRALAVSALQRIHDRTAQAAGAMRSQRATVVQTVTQGETVRAETEVVANYNHCHAMTIEYFEVLRHFRVEHEVAGVQECLFVPLAMSPFTERKALRWRSALEPRMGAKRLVAAFDAIDRRLHAYEGSDLPAGRYADEAIESLSGELTIEVSWVRPPDQANGEILETAWRGLAPFLFGLGGPAGVFATLFANRVAAERDRIFRETVVPNVIEELVAKLRVRLVRPAGTGGLREADLDATVVSKPRAGTPLRVTLRPKGAAPRIPRAAVEAVTIDVEDLDIGRSEARAIVRSGSLRYRTAHREDFLFRDLRIDNDLAKADAVRIDTPLNRQELRNPREEDKESARLLLSHLNGNLESCHRALWTGMDAARRFMLLDGVTAPGTAGRSVASVVENRVVAVVGNCLVMPVAPGFRLEPARRDGVSLLSLYAPTLPFPPVRLSLPTRGVFAEAVMGECNACEKIDDTRFWRWEESPIPGEAPAIQPVSTDSRGTASPDLSAKDFAAPIINLQNAPAAPDPTGLGAALAVVGAQNLFRDVTGLEGNQANAASALAGAFGTAASSAAGAAAAAKAVERASDLQMQQQVARDANKVMTLANDAVRRGDLPPEQGRAVQAATLLTASGVPGAVVGRLAELAFGGKKTPPTAAPATPPNQVTAMSLSTWQGQLNVANPPRVRAFYPPDDTDASIEIDARADVPLAEGLFVSMSCLTDVAPEEAQFGIVGKFGEVRLRLAGAAVENHTSAIAEAVRPGVCLVGFETRPEAGGAATALAAPGLAGAASVGERVLLALSVPLYVVISESGGELDRALVRFGLDAPGDKARFLGLVKKWAIDVLGRINIRLIWQFPGVEGFNEPEPAAMPRHGVSRPRLLLRDGNDSESHRLAIGLNHMNGVIEVFVGELLDVEDDGGVFDEPALARFDPAARMLVLLRQIMRRDGSRAEAARDRLFECVGRATAVLVAHEISHSVGTENALFPTLFRFVTANIMGPFGTHAYGFGFGGGIAPLAARDFGGPKEAFRPADRALLEERLPVDPPSAEVVLERVGFTGGLMGTDGKIVPDPDRVVPAVGSDGSTLPPPSTQPTPPSSGPASGPTTNPATLLNPFEDP